MSLMQRLESYRLQKNFTQAKLAEILKVTPITINRWLNEKVKPSKLKEYQIQQLLKPNKNHANKK